MRGKDEVELAVSVMMTAGFFPLRLTQEKGIITRYGLPWLGMGMLRCCCCCCNENELTELRTTVWLAACSDTPVKNSTMKF